MGRLVVVVLVLALALPALAEGRARPRAFASCAGLVGYAQRHFADTRGVPSRPVIGISEPMTAQPAPPAEGAAPQAASPTSAGTSFSTTNVQEEGVDEPDL